MEHVPVGVAVLLAIGLVSAALSGLFEVLAMPQASGSTRVRRAFTKLAGAFKALGALGGVLAGMVALVSTLGGDMGLLWVVIVWMILMVAIAIGVVVAERGKAGDTVGSTD
jgi:predicted permease